MGSKTPPKDQSERGAAAVLVAASLLLLMGISAVAVDVSASYNQRRQNQGAADLAVIAAMQFTDGNSASAAVAAGTAEAKEVVEASLGFTPDWATCTDGDMLALTDGSTDCISFSANLRTARVVIPDVAVDTTFAAVLGAFQIQTTAFAEAGFEWSLLGKVLPFGLPSGAASDSHICLRTTSHAGDSEPCDQNESGNFGTLDISLFGGQHTNQTCGNAQAQNKLKVNMALGVDHNFSLYNGTEYKDVTACNDGGFHFMEPNTLPGQTGVGSSLYDGMVGGVSNAQLLVSGYASGRLAQGGNTVPVDTSAPQIDDTPLWDFLISETARNAAVSSSNLAGECGGVIDELQKMLDCIDAWSAGDIVIFNETGSGSYIGDAIRFAAVPVLNTQNWGNGTKDYHISDIKPIYVEATYWKCTGGGGGKGKGKGGGGGGSSCDIAHFPGEVSTGSCSGWGTTSCGLGSNTNGKLEAVTAVVLKLDMLPESITATWPTTGNEYAYNLTK